MKRYLVENEMYVHMVLFLIWFSTLTATFMVGVEIFNGGTIIPLTALIAIILETAFAIVTTDWIDQVSKESGY